MKEIWKDVCGLVGKYKVSNFGRVKTLKRKCVPKDAFMKKWEFNGYNYVILYDVKLQKRKTLKLSLLVWDHFGDKPRNGRKLQVDHIDNNPFNDRIDNLQLLSCRDNNIKKTKRKKRKLPLGVYLVYAPTGLYRALISHKGKRIYLGWFYNIDEAAKAYQDAYNRFESLIDK